MASRTDWPEYDMPRDWIADDARLGDLVTTRQRLRDRGRVNSHDAEAELLRDGAALIDLLTLFGLTRSDDGSWIVQPELRAFAHAILWEHQHAYY